MASLSGTTGGTGGLGGTVGGWNVGFGGKNIGRRVGRTDALGSRTSGGKAGQPAATVVKKVEKAKAPVSVVSAPREMLGRRATAASLESEEVGTGIMGVTMTKTPARVGGLEAMREPGVPAGFTPASPTSYQKAATLASVPGAPVTSRQIAKELGPGEFESGVFQPERSVMGKFRDILGFERGVSPSLAAEAYKSGVLGELTTGLSRGVVQTENMGVSVRRDPLGSMLTVADVASSLFGLPSPAQMRTPVGAAFGVAPVIGTAQSLYGAFEEQQALSALSKAGIIEQAPARGVKPAALTDDQYASMSPVLGASRAAKPIAQTAAIKPYNEEAVRRARLKGFGSTIRTGAYGITGPLAVRA